MGIIFIAEHVEEGSDGDALQRKEAAMSHMQKMVHAGSAISGTAEDLRASGMPEGVAQEEMRGVERGT
jgi:hypothetical protein